MTNRNLIPFSSDEILADECRESARILALQFAETMTRLSDSSLDECYALSNLMMILTRIAYDDDQTTDTHLAFAELLTESDLDDFLFINEPELIPILRYFDRD